MEGGFRRILERLPFAILELHPDNGSEFFNQHLVRFWKDTVKGVQLSRSRPYHKNDNRFVEQKNSSLVRHYFGTLAGTRGGDECPLRQDVAVLQPVSTCLASHREAGAT
jgi:transposase InsO family protein